MNIKNIVEQTLPVQIGGFSKLLDQIGKEASSMDAFRERVWARFQNAPDYILQKLRQTPGSWNMTNARDGHPTWCGMCCEHGANLFYYIQRRRAMEKQYLALVVEYPRLACADIKQACWSYDLTVSNGQGPTVENWSYSDDHPGEYSDEAWTSSIEIAPGVWLEKRHACLGKTRAWVVLGPIPGVVFTAA